MEGKRMPGPIKNVNKPYRSKEIESPEVRKFFEELDSEEVILEKMTEGEDGTYRLWSASGEIGAKAIETPEEVVPDTDMRFADLHLGHFEYFEEL
ncbi:MAG: hypothetical protein O2807_02715 [bacterium]|nr:hypothetical protein [bacterium]